MEKKKRTPAFEARRVCVVAIGVIVASFLLSLVIPEPVDGTLGIFSVLPALFLVGYIFITKRILEALFLASLMGYILVARFDALFVLSDGLQSVLMSDAYQRQPHWYNVAEWFAGRYSIMWCRYFS